MGEHEGVVCKHGVALRARAQRVLLVLLRIVIGEELVAVGEELAVLAVQPVPPVLGLQRRDGGQGLSTAFRTAFPATGLPLKSAGIVARTW